MRTSYLSLFNFIKSYPLGNIEKKKGQRSRTAKFSGAGLRTEEDHSRIRGLL
jgi:hypothetical protein